METWTGEGHETEKKEAMVLEAGLDLWPMGMYYLLNICIFILSELEFLAKNKNKINENKSFHCESLVQRPLHTFNFSFSNEGFTP